jgi:hydrogenase-1 operon protein HyaF
MNSFPIPVVSIGPGSQAEDVELDYMVMPQGMQTFAAPQLPEPEELLGLTQAQATLRAVLNSLQVAATGAEAMPVDLSQLDAANLQLVNQVLGEGEVSARAEGVYSIRIQESIFAGVWRVIINDGTRLISDRIDIGPVPQILLSAALNGATIEAGAPVAIPADLPAGIMNAPSVMAELNEQLATWQRGKPAHVINLTLLPLSPEDVAFMEQALAGGSVLILSRGYGNCRILSTLVPNCWRVVYYNSADTLLLNTVEVTDIPEVACAAQEDLMDSCERLSEVLDWVASA